MQKKQNRPQPLPLSISTFWKIIKSGALYVDKTRYIYDLIKRTGGIYFLSRPRRFGKTLTVSTLEEIFQGNRELFQGLWIYEETDYEWDTYPIIRLDFSKTTVKNVHALEKMLEYYLGQIATEYGLTLDGYDYQTRFESLIQQLSQHNQVVILIDEYDKPILDNIGDMDEAIRIRDTLKAFYGVIKAADPYIHFVFITGISKFTKVGVFSDLNNLIDITMYQRYSAMVGITQSELEEYFEDHLAALAQQENCSVKELLEQLRYRYNGFCFAAKGEPVYNSYSTVLLFERQEFDNYWFESGTPSFLMNLIKERDYDIEEWEELKVDGLAFSTYDIRRLNIIPLLYQTGYLTIKEWHKDSPFDDYVYTLSYPNYEVKNSFLTYLLNAYSEVELELNQGYLTRLVNALRQHDIDRFFKILQVYYANINYELYVDHEKYYQTIFYSIFLMLGLRIGAEVKTNRGRIDAVIPMDDHIYLFEFKRDRTAQEALDQINNNAYYEKYQLHGKPITLIGVNFDSKKRQIEEWKHE